MASALKIGQLARLAGVGVETIRFYGRQGLLAAPHRTANGYRQYPPETARQLCFIRRARRLGFSLPEIGELMDLAKPSRDRGQVKGCTEQKIAEIDWRLAELERMRAALSDLSCQCRRRPALDGARIVEALVGTDGNQHT
jgi:MerR family mercuric resistance operon transcriptional regulator